MGADLYAPLVALSHRPGKILDPVAAVHLFKGFIISGLKAKLDLDFFGLRYI